MCHRQTLKKCHMRLDWLHVCPFGSHDAPRHTARGTQWNAFLGDGGTRRDTPPVWHFFAFSWSGRAIVERGEPHAVPHLHQCTLQSCCQRAE
jgi:hypothetical protein